MFGRVGVLYLLTIGFVSAQSTAIVRGEVTDSQGSPVIGAISRIENALTGFEKQVESNENGAFQITNIPFQTYILTTAKAGFAPSTQSVVLRTNIPQEVKIQLAVASQLTRVEVNATESTTL